MNARNVYLIFSVSLILLLVDITWLAGPSAAATRKKSVKSSGKTEEKKAEVFVFPVNPQKKRSYQPAETVLTGIFSGDSSQAMHTEKPGDDNAGKKDALLRRQPSRKKTEHTVAWMARDGLIYHDPFLECTGIASGGEKIWVNDVRNLCGLEPCDECYKKTNHAPEFIIRESKNLDLASGSSLLDNKAFISWLVEHLPVKNPGFLSTRRLLIYPTLEMTEQGLQQLARETELAYRRHTWKIIEVIGKKSDLDTGSVSSFSDEVRGP